MFSIMHYHESGFLSLSVFFITINSDLIIKIWFCQDYQQLKFQYFVVWWTFLIYLYIGCMMMIKMREKRSAIAIGYNTRNDWENIK